MSSVEQISPIVDAKLTELGFELFELRLFHAGSRAILRVAIDTAQGVTVADCERASHEISLILDTEGFLGGKPYTLEVSSPGIDRPLKTERDFRRIIGHVVTVHLNDEVNGKKKWSGEVIECENNILTLKIEDNNIRIPLSGIYSGREEIQFK